MARISAHSVKSLLGNSFVAGLAASTLLVGVVWTTSFATDGGDSSTDTTVVDDSLPPEDSVDDSVPDDSVPDDSVPDDSESGDNPDNSNGDTSDGTNTDSADLTARVASLEATIAELTTLLNDAQSTIATLKAQTVNLDANGVYSGTITPRQISPQLKVSDISGHWPLSKTDGDLPLSRVDIGFTTCRSDSRNYGVITVGSFRQLECVRIPK